MKIYHFIVAILLGGILSSCSNEGSVEVTDNAVIEAYLVAGQYITMHVKKEIPYSDQSISSEEPIDGLKITVTGDGNTYSLVSLGNGDYRSDTTVKLKVGVSYSMSFVYNGKTISATTIIPTKPENYALDQSSIYLSQIDLSSGGRPMGGMGGTNIQVTWDNTTSDYYFVVVDNIETDPTPIYILADDADSTMFTRRFRSQPVQGTSTSVNPNEFQYFGMHNVILMHVNPDYAALYRSSGSTSQNISTPPTSITNGLGVFTGVNADTLKFEVKQR